MDSNEFRLPGMPDNSVSNVDSPDYNPFEDPTSAWYGVSPDFRPRADRPIPSLKCVYIRADGSRCGRYAVRGTGITTGSKALCPKHGGSLPSIKNHAEKVVEASRLALVDSVPDAVNKLVKLVNSDTAPEQVQLNAAKEILDRAGLKGGPDMTVEVNLNEMKPSDKLSEKLAAMRKPAELEDMGEVVDEE